MMDILTVKIKFYLHKVMDYLVTIINTLKYQMTSRTPRVIAMMMLIVVGINPSVHNYWIKKYEICRCLSKYCLILHCIYI